MQGTDDIPCDCVHDNVASGSFSKVKPDLKCADLITCGRCDFRWFSNKEGIFNHGPCPRCGSKSPIMAELNQQRLAEGADFSRNNSQPVVQNMPHTSRWVVPFWTSNSINPHDHYQLAKKIIWRVDCPYEVHEHILAISIANTFYLPCYATSIVCNSASCVDGINPAYEHRW